MRVGSAWLFGKSRGSLFEMLAGGCRILGSRRIVRIYRDERYKCKGQVEKFVPKKGERDKRETYLYRRVIRIEKKERKKKRGRDRKESVECKILVVKLNHEVISRRGVFSKKL